MKQWPTKRIEEVCNLVREVRRALKAIRAFTVDQFRD